MYHNGSEADESDTIRQEHALERLHQIVTQCYMLAGSDAFLTGNDDLLKAAICLSAVESEWLNEHNMLGGEI